jgi:hypothetical protein
MILILIIIILIALYRKFNPDIDITRNKNVLLFYNYKNTRRFVKLFKMK